MITNGIARSGELYRGNSISVVFCMGMGNLQVLRGLKLWVWVQVQKSRPAVPMAVPVAVPVPNSNWF
jgi:hypothetical protein